MTATPVSNLRESLNSTIEWVGGVTLLALACVRESFRRPFEWKLLVEQLDRLGVRSLAIVTLTAAFTGMVLALHAAESLERYGAKQVIGQVVALSLVKEMGPVLTALVIAGRVGAGITAELGSMAVTEQVDAMRALGASPIKKLALPRVLAVLIMLPALSTLAVVLGIAGGAVVTVVDHGQALSVYVQACFSSLQLGDLAQGFIKSVVFAAFVSVFGCYYGLSARDGADGVGRATTATVVAASIAILTSDFFLTKLCMLLF